MSAPDISLVLPAYNEGKELKNTVGNISTIFQEEGAAFEIIVVNNGSTDNTVEVLSEITLKDNHVVAVHLAENQGYGGGILEGLKKARGNIVGWSDGDGQINPHDILQLYKVMQSQKAQAAKATRAVRQESVPRRVQSLFFNFLFFILFGKHTWDVNAKPKLMRREVLDHIKLTDRKYFIDAEWVIRLNRAGIPFVESPVKFLKRTHGKSKIRFWTSLAFIGNMIIYRIHLH